MSPLQQGLYYQSTLDGAGSTYIVQNTFDFDRHLDANRCRHALHALLARHPQLRVGFGTIEDGERTTAVQVVAAGLHPTSRWSTCPPASTPPASRAASPTPTAPPPSTSPSRHCCGSR
ncbi:hypothetical protein MANY_54190 [Mycolicibacterium anyangense]|uniref:Condensation domain-containing protein n=1 Tax=Mycolicibacterium anyangense TaxID=1431246 RepID=A0A6N4WJQ1_9MYCO|nr:condensation domain-containing protein [Mycolicibacterium anyangense]BBZ80082.1 hypothetical protein MANY_54190 [Mycolicibacterium anyangense]